MIFSVSGIPNGDSMKLGVNGNSVGSKIETPNVKKRHRRAKSGGIKSVGPGDGDGKYNQLLLFVVCKLYCCFRFICSL